MGYSLVSQVSPKNPNSSETGLYFQDGMQEMRRLVEVNQGLRMRLTVAGKRWNTGQKGQELALKLGYASGSCQAIACNPSHSVE